MKHSTLTITLIIAMILLIAAGVISFITPAPSPDPQNSPDSVQVTPEEGSTDSTATPPITPLLTLPPVATPAPTTLTTPTAAPTPVQTAQPTPVPTPSVKALGSGSFVSNTGVPINLVCSWSAKTSGSGTAEITVTAALESYALHVNSSANALRFTVNGSSIAADMPTISTDTTEPIRTDLGSASFSVTIAEGSTITVPISVEWMFGGVYSDVQLDVVTASTTVTLTR